MSFLRGGMKPRTGDAAVLVAAPGVSCVVAGFVFAALTAAVAADPAGAADPAASVAAVEEVVEGFLASDFRDDEPVPAEEPCVDFALVDGAASVAVGAAFAVL